MSELDERLRALDPFAGAPYEHGDAAELVARVTRAAPRTRRRRRLPALLGPLAVASAASLAAVGVLVAAGPSAPQLAALSIRSAPTAAATTATSPSDQAGTILNGPVGARSYSYDPSAWTTSGDKALGGVQGLSATSTARPYLYEGAYGLPVSAPSLDAFAAIAPRRPGHVLTAAAAELGLTGRVAHTASTWRLDVAPSSWVVRYAALERSPSTGLETFRYLHLDVGDAGQRCAPSRAVGPADRDRAGMVATLAHLLRALGANYSLASPATTTSWYDGPLACTALVHLTEHVVVGGAGTDQLAQVVFAPSGAVVAASIPAFTVGSSAAYPLVSAARAASVLDESSFAAAVSEGGVDGVAAHRVAGTASQAGLMVVELQRSSTGLRAFLTTSGATWLLPVYLFTGLGYSRHAKGATRWSGAVLAPASPLVRVKGSRDTQAWVFYLSTGTAGR